jgi:hypothetical protein
MNARMYLLYTENKKAEREGWEVAIVAEDWRGWGKDPKKKTTKNQ